MTLEEKVITQPEELAECCAHLASVQHFGLDTEFVGEDTYHPRLCLIQVATADALYLIDPFTAGSLEMFWKVVVDPANQVVVHAGREEVRLCSLNCGQPPGNLFDLQIAAGLVGLAYPLGHGTLVSQVLGVQLAKGETLTEWRNRPLAASQIRYAFDDVRYLLPVWKDLNKRLQKLDRGAWAQEEFARLSAHARVDEPSPGVADKWRKLRGVGALDRRRLAMVRELYFWREETATQANRPPRTIVRDDLLIEIARRNPLRERDLHVVRGLARRYAAPLFHAVERARALAIEECPALAEREQDPPQVGLVVNILNAVLADFAVRRQLAPNLIASNQDLKALVRAELQRTPPPADALLTAGWRAVHVLPELQAVLKGRRRMRIGDLSQEAPFLFEDA
jgi:ribonuclease D